jgi:hypothetical protein
MNISKMIKKQCETIISNNYLGKPDIKGKQVDYSDYSFQIDMRLCDLNDKIIAKKLLPIMNKPAYEAIIDASDVSTHFIKPKLELPTFLRLGFVNKWASVAQRLSV